MTQMAELLELIDKFKSESGIESDGALSARMFNDGKKIAALRSGGDITLGRAARCMAWMSENWPDGKDLPSQLVLIDRNEP